MFVKRMIISQLLENPAGPNLEKIPVAVRGINIHHSFIGINSETGVTNFRDFKNLADDLEPGVPNKRISILDI
jgi:hypothetical protein